MATINTEVSFQWNVQFDPFKEEMKRLLQLKEKLKPQLKTMTSRLYPRIFIWEQDPTDATCFHTIFGSSTYLS